jgi:GntR family transcriptional regulator, carbon starvation induced regulator
MDNSRSALLPAPALGPSRHEVTRATLADQVESAIRKDIIEGALAPGLRITAQELTDRYGVSATPLREALQRLQGRHLVTIDPRSGASVTAVSLDDLRDTYRALDIVGGAAVARSIELGDATWAAKLDAAWEAFRETSVPDRTDDHAGIATWAAVHRSFHDTLVAACDSKWLVEFADILSDHTERYRIRSLPAGDRLPLAEHESIWRFAIARSIPSAVEAYRAHLWRTVELLSAGVPW